MRRLAGLAAAVFIIAGAAPAHAEPRASRVGYRPPVDAPIVDPFRPPPTEYAAGNRGVDYGTQPGTPVRAAADGDVVFAGPVGGTLHVVVLHADGLRTSYSFLRSITVHRGDQVRQGQEVGTAAERLHFGARAGTAYIDPTLLFSAGPPHVYLVPDDERRRGTVVHERDGLLDSLRGIAAGALAIAPGALGWAREGFSLAGSAGAVAVRGAADRFDELEGAAHYAWELQPGVHLARAGQAGLAWWRQRQSCTPASTPAPRHAERHVAVLVGGLGSSSTNAAVDSVHTAALGYAPGDVVRFSYRGGTTDENPYDPIDSTADIRQSARRLRELLERLASEHPGVPIDVVAHSQGGLVARAALGDEVDPGSPRVAPVASLVTLGTPHQGADLATGARMIGKTAVGKLAIHGLSLAGAPVEGASVSQLAETSEFVRRLNRRPLPVGMRVTSIGSRGDVVVPAGRTHLSGAKNVIVSTPGLLDQHGRLPGSDAATREIALGQAGMPPTCQSLIDMMVDETVSDSVGWLEDTAATNAWLAGRVGGVPTGLATAIHEGKEP